MGAVLVHEMPRLGQDLEVLTREPAQAIHRVNEKVRRERNLVVIHEDGDVMPEHRARDKPHVANGPVAAQ